MGTSLCKSRGQGQGWDPAALCLAHGLAGLALDAVDRRERLKPRPGQGDQEQKPTGIFKRKSTLGWGWNGVGWWRDPQGPQVLWV